MPDIPFDIHWWVDEDKKVLIISLFLPDGTPKYQGEIKLADIFVKDPKDPF